ncbi:GCD complex subunit gcd7, partial [Coemansia sp. RSA 2706]
MPNRPTMQPQAYPFSREITKYIDNFVTRLRRGQVVESKDIAIETASLMRHVISDTSLESVDMLVDLIKAVGRRLVEALPRELLIVNAFCWLLHVVREESESVEFVEDAWASGKP